MEKAVFRLILIFLPAMYFWNYSYSQDILQINNLPFNPESYVCYRTDKPVKIDGRLDEAAWKQAPWTNYFQDIEGPSMPAPLHQTRAKVLWDDKYLYFAAYLEEPDLWGTLTERESVIFQDNDFEIFLDPDGDTHQYYEFEINALGTEWDLMLVKPYRDGGPSMNGWTITGMKTAVHLDGTLNNPSDRDQGWSVEIAMPWEILKECAPGKRIPSDGDQWRMDFSRVQWRLDVKGGKYVKRINPATGRSFPEYNWVWSAPGVISMHQPEKWGYLQFSDELVGKAKADFQWDPDEKIKWALREIYYRQQEYYGENHRYAGALADLGLKAVRIEGKEVPVEVYGSPHTFEASCPSSGNLSRWHILQDGKIWQQGVPAAFPGKTDQWHGFIRYMFDYQGVPSMVVAPDDPLPHRPWIWRARFWGHEPQLDIALLEQGFHLVYHDVSNLFGSPQAVDRWNDFYRYLTAEYNFHPRPVLEGMSRGGLIIYNWAIANPGKVSCIYADAPVLDIRSWPGGKFNGKGSPRDWQKCMEVWGLNENSVENAPLIKDRLKPLADAGVPLIHICGDADDIVPVEENTLPLQKAYEDLGGKIEVILKEGIGHHPHSLSSPAPLLKFIERETGLFTYNPDKAEYFQLRRGLANSYLKFSREKKGTVAFLGGSITWNPGWRDKVCAYLKARFPQTEFTFINAGIPSTGSTPGAFRFENDVLSHGKIDLLFEEAAVNDDTNGRTDQEQRRGMEGIIRHAMKNNPEMDVVVMYFVDPGKMEDYRAGKIPQVIVNHEAVARHYQVASLDLAREVTERIDAGEFTWEGDFKDLHPSPFGQEVYFQSMKKMLETAWTEVGQDQVAPYEMPESPLDEFAYDAGALVPPGSGASLKKFTLQPDWKPADSAGTRRGFVNVPVLEAVKPNASLTFDFRGRGVGLWVIAGPDVGTILWSVDDGPEQSLNQFTKWSGFLHLPWVYMLESELPAGDHTLKLKTKQGENGAACRIVWFVVNE